MFLEVASCLLTFHRGAKCQHLSSTHSTLILYLRSLIFSFSNIPNACSITKEKPLNEPPVRPHSNCVHVLPPPPFFFVLFVVAMFVFVFLHAFATTFQDKDRGKMLVHKIERKKENEKRKLFHTRAWPRVPCLDRVIEISLVYIEPCEHDSVCVCACAYVCAKTELSGDLAHMCICGVLVRVRGVRATRATLCPRPHARWCTYRNTRDFDKERLLYMCIHHIVVYDLFFFLLFAAVVD